jgi:DnaK suppressor protein
MALTDNAEIGRLRARLDAREAQLRSEVDALRGEEAGALGKPSGGHVEDAGESGEENLRNATRNVEQRRDVGELRAIASARQRISDGVYGDCADCGCEISLARLQAEPAAARCIACQERFEQSRPAVPPVPLPGSRPDTPRRRS